MAHHALVYLIDKIFPGAVDGGYVEVRVSFPQILARLLLCKRCCLLQEMIEMPSVSRIHLELPKKAVLWIQSRENLHWLEVLKDRTGKILTPPYLREGIRKRE
jgi:hypothetical protein